MPKCDQVLHQLPPPLSPYPIFLASIPLSSMVVPSLICSFISPPSFQPWHPLSLSVAPVSPCPLLHCVRSQLSPVITTVFLSIALFPHVFWNFLSLSLLPYSQAFHVSPSSPRLPCCCCSFSVMFQFLFTPFLFQYQFYTHPTVIIITHCALVHTPQPTHWFAADYPMLPGPVHDTHTHTHSHTRACTCTHVHAHTYTRMPRTNTHAHAHTRARTHTHQGWR